jgi:hypothetical protein
VIARPPEGDDEVAEDDQQGREQGEGQQSAPKQPEPPRQQEQRPEADESSVEGLEALGPHVPQGESDPPEQEPGANPVEATEPQTADDVED